MIQGMNAKTGKKISEVDHLKQSLIDIMTTPIGSRVMNRNYGSTLHLYYDKPMDDYNKAQIQAVILNAITTFEPRFRPISVQVKPSARQHELSNLLIDIKGLYLPHNKAIEFNDLAV